MTALLWSGVAVLFVIGIVVRVTVYALKISGETSGE